MRKLTDSVDFARTEALAQKLLGYPLEPTHRGAFCPPAPFGRSTQYSTPVPDPDQAPPEDGQADTRPLVYPIKTDLEQALADGRAARLSAAERTELAAKLAKATGTAVAAQEKR
jgi:hypothetical protein